MSAAERTNESATKSAPSSTASAEVGDVLLGDRGQLGPRVGDVDALARRQRAGRDARARRRPPPSTRSTAKRGTPSPITISERSVTSAAKLGEVDDHAVVAAAPAPRRSTCSPTCDRARLGRRAESRSFGPWRSNSSPSGRPARSRRRAHLGARGGAGRRACRASSSGARSRGRPRRAGRARRAASVAGPSVATIFVRRSSMRRECCIESVARAVRRRLMGLVNTTGGWCRAARVALGA